MSSRKGLKHHQPVAGREWPMVLFMGVMLATNFTRDAASPFRSARFTSCSKAPLGAVFRKNLGLLVFNFLDGWAWGVFVFFHVGVLSVNPPTFFAGVLEGGVQGPNVFLKIMVFQTDALAKRHSSKRIHSFELFPPKISLINQMIGASISMIIPWNNPIMQPAPTSSMSLLISMFSNFCCDRISSHGA